MASSISKSSEPLTNDLPVTTGLPTNVVVRDLDVMPGIPKIRAATFGRGVWESEFLVDTLVGWEPNGLKMHGGEGQLVLEQELDGLIGVKVE